MKRSLKMPFLVLFMLLLMIFSGAAAASAPSLASRPVLNGTCIQLLEENGKWSSARWERLFGFFQTLGLTGVVVQWSILDSTAFHIPNSGEPLSPVENILKAAEARGIGVYLGLAAESRYWEMIKQPAAGQEKYLRQLRLRSEHVAAEVAPLAGKYPRAFRGWYIPEEIDDITWRAPDSRKVIYRHLSELSAQLKRLAPGKEVLVSAFSNGRMSPDSYQGFWRDLLKQSSIDTLLFQDGAGVGKLPEELLPVYLKSVRAATDASNKKLQVVVELFEQVSESPFAARPATFPRAARQLEVAGRFASGGITAFSISDYMSYDGNVAARELLDAYLKYRGSGSHPR